VALVDEVQGDGCRMENEAGQKQEEPAALQRALL
jgi:hypothetical protein